MLPIQVIAEIPEILNVNTTALLSYIIFTPLLGAVILLFLPRKNIEMIRAVSATATGLTLVLVIYLVFSFNKYASNFQFVQQYDWIKVFNIQYFVGVDGISIAMIFLTALISFICVFASWEITKGTKGYYALFLILETGMLGVFCALDFFLFYVFWEVMLLPMYFLIGIWGGPRKEYAAIKFFIYTLAGSVLMLIVMLTLYFNCGHTFNLLAIMDQANHSGIIRASLTLRYLLYLGLFIGFAIKVPVFPFHTWLPDAHVEAPTAISVILAGILLKMGIYGIFRISYTIFPDIAYNTAIYLALLGVINIIYGALCAMAQSDLKKLVAYSSVSHMGYCLLGLAALTSAGMHGSMMQMFNHGTITGMLFLLVGVIYVRAHSRNIDGFGGLAQQMPVYAGFTALAFFASLGLPGLSGFIGEALTFIGAFTIKDTIYFAKTIKIMAAIGTLGIVLTAGYFLWAYQRMFMGPKNSKYDNLSEINGREIFTIAPLALITLILGFFPSILLNYMGTSLENLIQMVNKGYQYWANIGF